MVYGVCYHSYCGIWPAEVARGGIEHKPLPTLDLLSSVQIRH